MFHRKVVVLFSADETTAEIKSSIWENIIQKKYGGGPPEQKEHGNSHGRKHRGIWEAWPEDENQRGRQDNGLKTDKEALGKRTCEFVSYLSTGL